MGEYEDEDARTVFCANLSDKVTEALLYELFLQGGPLEKISQPKDKDGRNRSFAFITYVHAISVPYAVGLFQGTQLFNRELSIKPRNNNSSNVQPKVDNPMAQQQQQQPQPPSFPMRNPFESNARFGNDRNERPTSRFDRNNREPQPLLGLPFEQTAPLRSGFNPIPTKASMQMQPQPSKRPNHQSPGNALNLNDMNKLISMGANMLQSNSRQADMMPTRPTYDLLFADRDTSASRHSNNLKMANRHTSRSHHRDEPYSRRDPPRHQQRSGDRRRR